MASEALGPESRQAVRVSVAPRAAMVWAVASIAATAPLLARRAALVWQHTRRAVCSIVSCAQRGGDTFGAVGGLHTP